MLRRGLPPFGLVDRYLVLSTARLFLPLLGAVTAALLMERAIRVVQELAAREADIGYLAPILLSLLPFHLHLAIPVAFMTALILLVVRLDEHLELEAMLAEGFSLGRIALPLAGLGLAIGLAALLVGGWLEPLGRHHFRQLRIEATNAARVAALQPRALYRPSDTLMLTVDRSDGAGGFSNLFLWQSLGEGRSAVATARRAGLLRLPEEQRLVLRLADGDYVDYRAGRPPRMIRFAGVDLTDSLLIEARWPRGRDAEELTLGELIAGPPDSLPRAEALSEAASRIARAAMVPLIPFLVLPLVFAIKKGHRALGILLSGILLAAIHHGINFAKRLAENGDVDPLGGIGAVTAGALLIVILLFLSARHLPSHSPISSLTEAVGRSWRRVRPRRPRPGAWGTLGAYARSRLAGWTAGSLLVILLILQMVDLLDRGDDLVERGLGTSEILHYLLLRLPPMVERAIPFAMLAGAMITLGGFARRREMVAVRAAGVSQSRMLLRLLPVPLLLSTLAAANSALAVPASQAAYTAWWAARSPAPATGAARPHWFRVGDSVVRIAAASPDATRLEEVDIYRRGPEGRLSEHVRADRALRRAGGWSLEAVRLFRPGDPGLIRLAARDWNDAPRPGDLLQYLNAPALPSPALARRALEQRAPSGAGTALYRTRLWRAFAAPLAPIVMLLLAMPLGFISPHVGTSGRLLFQVAGGGLLYLLADGLLTVAAETGRIGVVAGAWGAPALGLLGASAILLFSER